MKRIDSSGKSLRRQLRPTTDGGPARSHTAAPIQEPLWR